MARGNYLDDQNNPYLNQDPGDYTLPGNLTDQAGGAPPPTPDPTPTNTGGTGDTGSVSAYDMARLRSALLAYNVPASSSALKAFIAAHPEFSQGVTVGGSKGNKLYGPNGEYLADVIRATDGPNPSWAWDTGEGGGGGNAVDPSYLAPWTTEFEAPANAQLPSPFSYQDFSGFTPFTAPTGDTILQDPSYQFRQDQMVGALQNSAAGKGLINSGGTLRDILDQTGKYASLEYQNIWNRDFNAWNTNNQNALTTYGTNRDNASDAWSKNYGLAKDAYSQAWNTYLDKENTFYKNQDAPFSKLLSLGQLGASAAS